MKWEISRGWQMKFKSMVFLLYQDIIALYAEKWAKNNSDSALLDWIDISNTFVLFSLQKCPNRQHPSPYTARTAEGNRLKFHVLSTLPLDFSFCAAYVFYWSACCIEKLDFLSIPVQDKQLGASVIIAWGARPWAGAAWPLSPVFISERNLFPGDPFPLFFIEIIACAIWKWDKIKCSYWMYYYIIFVSSI